MKDLRKILFLAVSLVFAACHSNDDYDGDFVKQTTSFPAKGRTNAVSFVINGKAYVGLGITDDSDECKDFHCYEPNSSWGANPVDDFPGKARYGAVAFTDGTYGYVGLGYAENTNATTSADRVKEWFNDFYRFDPTAAAGSQWTKIEDFPGYPRKFAVAFYAKETGKGYVGTGEAYNLTTNRNEGEQNDFWSYDIATGKWSESARHSGSERQGAVTFEIDGSIYVVTGFAGSTLATDFIRYTPATDTWEDDLEPLRNLNTRSWDNHYSRIPRRFAVAYVLDTDKNLATGQNKRAYLVTGYNSTGLAYTVFEYNPYDIHGDKGNTGYWREITEVPNGLARQMAVSYVLNNVPYIALGGSGIASSSKKTIFTFIPDIRDNDQNDD